MDGCLFISDRVIGSCRSWEDCLLSLTTSGFEGVEKVRPLEDCGLILNSKSGCFLATAERLKGIDRFRGPKYNLSDC